MNIVVKPYGSDRCYCRPDTTWERENKDFYVPDSVNEVFWTPVVFARVSKAGKCINPKFVSRYYDAANFGILLYMGSGETAFTSCADHTSLLPFPLYNTIVMENDRNMFTVERNGEAIFTSLAGEKVVEAVENAICRASMMTSLRIGDFVAVELKGQEALASKEECKADIRTIFCENSTIETKIIF